MGRVPHAGRRWIVVLATILTKISAMTTTTDLVADARAALLTERRRLTLAEIQALADLGPASTPALADLAHEVRLEWCGDMVEVEGILSVKTGGCPEDCQFCSLFDALNGDES